ncbi:hypothetical protein [Calothrix sp. 336/3]|uniref:hypothetical protein n=1 Tax=Calothrix sp. 336/3 TaxID=1337936 RepID=UPI0004E3B6B3|nr:hypothetical protein [Calothrix sp. 336/3]AKG23649.1 hypothetical protein IJ00_22280 [Calothrix sp. 336/3]
MNRLNVYGGDANTLRQLWSVVEVMQSSLILKLNDADLVKQLLKELDQRKALSNEESNNLTDYIHARTALIRDLAEARMAECY